MCMKMWIGHMSVKNEMNAAVMNKLYHNIEILLHCAF